jgi:hypothetical protein
MTSRLRRWLARAIPPVYVALVTALWLVPVAPLGVRATSAATAGHVSALIALALGALGFSVGAMAPARWLALGDWERNGSLYARIGVRRFRTIALHGDVMNRLRRRLAGGTPVAGPTIARRAALTRWILYNERIHWAWVLGTPPLIVWGAASGYALLATFTFLALVPLNLYPIALQRYTRGRLARIDS